MVFELSIFRLRRYLKCPSADAKNEETSKIMSNISFLFSEGFGTEEVIRFRSTRVKPWRFFCYCYIQLLLEMRRDRGGSRMVWNTLA